MIFSIFLLIRISRIVACAVVSELLCDCLSLILSEFGYWSKVVSSKDPAIKMVAYFLPKFLNVTIKTKKVNRYAIGIKKRPLLRKMERTLRIISGKSIFKRVTLPRVKFPAVAQRANPMLEAQR